MIPSDIWPAVEPRFESVIYSRFLSFSLSSENQILPYAAHYRRQKQDYSHGNVGRRVLSMDIFGDQHAFSLFQVVSPLVCPEATLAAESTELIFQDTQYGEIKTLPYYDL